MPSKKKDKKQQLSTDRRDFLKNFFKKGKPLVAGVVTKPLSKFVPDNAGETPTSAVRRRAARQAETIAEDLRKEFEKTHEDFLKDNPDFFDNI
ncbi:MAG: hypothetical protein PHX83_06325 [Acidobacteriia bacterium]|nr:hypothetical protein [Terriglobia bacterium]